MAVWTVAAVALTAGIVATLCATRYGYYYDELYFIAAGKRPTVGYADQGPLVPLLAVAMDRLFPGSLVALRIPGILAALVVVVFSAVIARELGGGRRAQLLAAIGCATAPGVLGVAGSLTTNGVDSAFWVLSSWLVLRWVRTRHDRLLLTAGMVTIVALQVKWLVPVFWIALLVAVGCLGPRQLLRRPALWCAAAVAAVSVLPALIWQAHHGWPQVGMGALIRGQTAMLYGQLTFLPRAIWMCGVLGAVLVLYGGWRLWRSPRLRPYRFLGLAFVIMVAIFAIAGGRSGYGIGLYGAVIAAGAVDVEALADRWTRMATVPVIVVSIAVFVVDATPWRAASQLSPATDFTAGVAEQAYGEFGWPQLTSTVAAAYHRLPADQQRNAVIVTERYIQASALDYYRSAAGLPAVFSPKRGFGYFGAPPDTATTVLWVGSTKPELQRWFTSTMPAANFGVRLGMPQVTRDITIWTCTVPRQPWSVIWPKMQSL